MAGHTPGPWQVSAELFDIENRPIELSPGGPVIAVVWPMGEDFDDTDTAPQREANARLIAAAPDLLAVVRELAAAVYDDTEDGPFRACCGAPYKYALPYANVPAPDNPHEIGCTAMAVLAKVEGH